MRCPECTEEMEKINPFKMYKCSKCKEVFQIHTEKDLEEIGKFFLDNPDKKASDLIDEIGDKMSKEFST